ncbi:MAG TPA: aldolase catalytic domain-containing protein [Syntrophorhabdaceae bacterium]|jgi:4-hydroxy 2-oxovalerate aldolase|nr:aldolase catalytic domain-containing protein [Syntrophorhabdaceae bacterium]HOS05300.1 aldolase catalytic domain-containing protein [Syntrophorhabdaceae bacterium]HPL40321.1 aldolase catalytic domain-containing protein [Syntrophorhabdaceae bacterium]HQM75857.1 aldolase catalytic domain-containing protein [Syntrophorhabdaceae bacterium]
MKDTYKILDCTIRDGGYLNNWHFDKRMVREVYRALSKAGIDVVEIGFRGTEKYFKKQDFGLWRFTDIEDLKDVVQGINGAKIAIMGDFGKLDTDDITDEYLQYVSLVRIAAHKDGTPGAIKQLEAIKKKGFEVSLQAMGITSYTHEEINELVNMLKDSTIDYSYIADSYGSILPDQMRSLIEPFKELTHIKIGFHPHNGLQMAFANTLEAIKCGVDIVDSTIYGMGRGAGNLPTEVLLSYLQLSTTDKYNVIPVLHAIDRFFMNIETDEPWGYQLTYMLSGIFQCHPYYPKTLVDYREYSMEDIWSALEVVKKLNPVGFSKNILNDIIKSGMIGGLKKGKTRKVNESKNEPKKIIDVPYVNRHAGRDFLILASGPTLKEYKTKIEKFISKNDPIIMGANYLSGLFKPHYHAFNNKKRFEDYIDTVDKDSTLMLGDNLPADMVREYTSRVYETLYFIDELDDFGIKDGVIQSNCRTIAVLLMGLAIVMGADRIFAAGMDGYAGFDPNEGFHFYNEKVETEDEDLIIERHRYNQHFLEQIDGCLRDSGKEGIHILTPTSHKAFYKGIENYIK